MKRFFYFCIYVNNNLHAITHDGVAVNIVNKVLPQNCLFSATQCAGSQHSSAIKQCLTKGGIVEIRSCYVVE